MPILFGGLKPVNASSKSSIMRFRLLGFVYFCQTHWGKNFMFLLKRNELLTPIRQKVF